jgi:Protein of unknown function (DUF541)
MKKLLAVSFSFLLHFAAVAQDNYIEVVVTDTMIVEPQEWNYFVYLQSHLEAAANTPVGDERQANDPKVLQQKRAAVKATIDSLRTLAQQHGGEITGDSENPLNFTLTPTRYYGDEAPQYLSVRFTNRQGIENFIRAIRHRGDLEGRITATTHPDMPPYTDRLNVRIMQNARQKAAKLAQLGGRTLGPIILISEVVEPEKNFNQGLFEKMMEADRTEWLPGWHAGSPDYPTDKIKLEKTLRVRFAFK